MTIKENLYYLGYFGFKLTFFKTLNTLFKRTRGGCAWKMREINNAVIEQYLKKVCSRTYAEIKTKSIEKNKGNHIKFGTASIRGQAYGVIPNHVIWTMWWQGEENAPEIVQACIRSMRKYSNGHPVVVLDESNWKEYVDLPHDIVAIHMESIHTNTGLGQYTLDQTKLSDIIRFQLLYNFGGVWADATVMFSDYIEEAYFTEPWVTLGQDNEWYIGDGKWCTFFMGCHKENPMMKVVYDMHIEYWRKKKYYVHYLMVDYMIDIVYKEMSGISDMINNGITKNRKCLTVNRRYNETVQEQEIQDFLREQHFHKLSWRWWGNEADSSMVLRDKEGAFTWFGWLYWYINT